MAAHLERDDSPVSGRVLTIMYAYVDYVTTDRRRTPPETRPRAYGRLCPPPAIVDFCTDEQLVLFKLIGHGSPFDTFRLDPRMEASTTESFQFLLLIRGARPETPGEGD
jgi:hypothetical protein